MCLGISSRLALLAASIGHDDSSKSAGANILTGVALLTVIDTFAAALDILTPDSAALQTNFSKSSVVP